MIPEGLWPLFFQGSKALGSNKNELANWQKNKKQNKTFVQTQKT